MNLGSNITATACLAALLAAPIGAAPAADCESLAQLHLPDTTITRREPGVPSASFA